MKKIITAVLLAVVLCSAAFAGGKDLELLGNLNNALKNSKQVTWATTETHKRAAFAFNNQTVFACYNLEDDALIGYSIHLAATDLPKASQDAIAKKYPGWQIVETIMFIDSYGKTNHFVQAQKGKKNIALKVNDDKVSFYRQMYIK
jgi:hypothetical protein